MANLFIYNYDRIPVFYYFENVNKGHLIMLSVKYENGQIWLYYCFTKIIKGPETSFQSPALNKKYIRNVCHTAH